MAHASVSYQRKSWPALRPKSQSRVTRTSEFGIATPSSTMQLVSVILVLYAVATASAGLACFAACAPVCCMGPANLEQFMALLLTSFHIGCSAMCMACASGAFVPAFPMTRPSLKKLGWRKRWSPCPNWCLCNDQRTWLFDPTQFLSTHLSTNFAGMATRWSNRTPYRATLSRTAGQVNFLSFGVLLHTFHAEGDAWLCNADCGWQWQSFVHSAPADASRGSRCDMLWHVVGAVPVIKIWKFLVTEGMVLAGGVLVSTVCGEVVKPGDQQSCCPNDRRNNQNISAQCTATTHSKLLQRKKISFGCCSPRLTLAVMRKQWAEGNETCYRLLQ